MEKSVNEEVDAALNVSTRFMFCILLYWAEAEIIITVTSTKFNPVFCLLGKLVIMLQDCRYFPNLIHFILFVHAAIWPWRTAEGLHLTGTIHHFPHAVCSFCPYAWQILGHRRQQMDTLAPSAWRRTKKKKERKKRTTAPREKGVFWLDVELLQFPELYL